MKALYVAAALAVVTASGCSKTNDFTPKAGASGEDIFNTGCFECHDYRADPLFVLSKDMGSAQAIAEKIGKGSLGMPSFPNIQGEDLQKLSEYVLSKSKVE